MRRAFLILLTLAVAGASATAAQAKPAAPPVTDVGIQLYPVPKLSIQPPGFAISAGQALKIAETSPKMLAIHRVHHPLQWEVYLWVASHYEVYFSFHGQIVGDVMVFPNGKLGPTYTGPQIIGVYARGHYGQTFDSPWLWGTFGAMFIVPLVFLRRRSWWDVCDLAVLLTFGVSYVLFDHLHTEAAVWLAYPPLLYLLARMLVRGSGPRRGLARIDCRLPVAVLAIGVLALTAGRIYAALAAHQVIDVGEASAIGAWKIIHGQPIYFPSLGHPDTYGPIAYLAYVPFQLIWPGASWQSYLPSVRAGTITFDLITTAGLVLLGVRLRSGRDGWRLGLLMAWFWAACPFSVLGLVKNTNDGLVAMFAVLVMLSLTAPVRKGVLLGLAAAAKFFPAILIPLMGAGDGRRDGLHARKMLAGFVIAAGASIALFLPPAGLKQMYEHTLGYQFTRVDIFSPWALHPGLAPIKDAIELGVVVLALLVAFRPRGERSPAQIGALAAALVIAVQLPALHWFYLYITWFLPLVVIAVLAFEPRVQAEVIQIVDKRPAHGEVEPSQSLAAA
jgi:hypothetical protein